jgi:hypothetical protein
VKGLYNENYNTSKKEIEEGTRRWKDLPCSWINRISIMTMTISPISIKIQMSLFTEIEKFI